MIHSEDIDAVHSFIIDNAPDDVVECWQSLKAAVLGQPDVQQLKAEIAALVTELDGLYLDQDMPKCTVAHYVNKLRQLSAV